MECALNARKCSARRSARLLSHPMRERDIVAA